MDFREIQHGTDDYRRAIALRFEVLRKPLPPGAADDDYDAEIDYLHFGLFDGDDLTACCFIVPMKPHQGRLRQMAVRPDLQKSGLGRRLIREVETHLAHRGYQKIILHARHVAMGFYERVGYRVTSDEFNEVGLPHFRMAKQLGN